jgi:hypothetical protein
MSIITLQWSMDCEKDWGEKSSFHVANSSMMYLFCHKNIANIDVYKYHKWYYINE